MEFLGGGEIDPKIAPKKLGWKWELTFGISPKIGRKNPKSQQSPNFASCGLFADSGGIISPRVVSPQTGDFA
jgi:hypothetical protein